MLTEDNAMNCLKMTFYCVSLDSETLSFVRSNMHTLQRVIPCKVEAF